MKRSTTVALREELRDAQAKVARLARECAGLRASGADNAHALDMVTAENTRLRAENATLQTDRSALTVERAEARQQRDLAEAQGAEARTLLAEERMKVSQLQDALRAASAAHTDGAVAYGHLQGTLDVLTRLVLAGDHDAAKAVAQGIAGMVTP